MNLADKIVLDTQDFSPEIERHESAIVIRWPLKTRTARGLIDDLSLFSGLEPEMFGTTVCGGVRFACLSIPNDLAAEVVA